MRCIICGREASRPICHECTKNIIEERPFLLRRSLLSSAFETNLEDAIERGLLTDSNIEELNLMAKKVQESKEENHLLLAKAALLFHKKYSFYLENFEIDEDYYLSLAEKFVDNIKNEEGEYLRYLILKERGNLKRALKILDSLLRKNSNREYLLEKAKTLLEIGDKDSAFIIYEEMLKEDECVWKELGDALFEMGNCEDAKKIYAKVIELKNDEWDVYYKLGICMSKSENYEAAINYFNKVLSLNKYHLESYIELISIYKKLNMIEEIKKLKRRLRTIGFSIEEVG